MKASMKNKNDSTWFVAALEEEFTSDKHNVLYTGMGKINAAMAVQWLIDNFNVKKIINVGSAGGNPTTIATGRIYHIGTVVDRDWGFPESGPGRRDFVRCPTLPAGPTPGRPGNRCLPCRFHPAVRADS